MVDYTMKEHYWNRAPKPDLALSPSLAYIIGVGLGDAFIGKDRRAHKISLTVKDQDFAVAFRGALKQLGVPSKFRKDKKRGIYAVVAFNKWFVTWWLRKPALQEIIEAFPVDFIRGFYDSEGSLYKDGRWPNSWRLSIANTDKDKIDMIAKTLQNLGFDISIKYARTNKCYQLFPKGGLGEIVHFLMLVKPRIKRKSLEAIKSGPRKRLVGEWQGEC